MRKTQFGLATIALAAGLTLLSSMTSTAQAYVGLCCGSCGGNMPLNTPGAGIPETYEFRVKLSTSYMQMDGLRDGTDNLSVADVHQDFPVTPTSMDMTMGMLSVAYAPLERLALMAMFPVMHKEMPHLRRDGERFSTDSTGLGDVSALAKYRLWADDELIPTAQVSVLAGSSFPTGSIDERDIVFGNNVQLPMAMQLGSGTIDPVIGLLYEQSASPWWWGVNVRGKMRLYDNDRGYRLGNEWSADIYGMFQLRHDLLVNLQLNLKDVGTVKGNDVDVERFGRTPMDTPLTPTWDPKNYGGTRLDVTAGVQWQPLPLTIVELQGFVPVYQDLNGPQLETDWGLRLVLYWEIPTPASVRWKGSAPSEKTDALGF